MGKKIVSIIFYLSYVSEFCMSKFTGASQNSSDKAQLINLNQTTPLGSVHV